jgi:two-component system LytT family sensor kinase
VSAFLQAKLAAGREPPPPNRTYWICQAVGWGGFTLYTLVAYVMFVTERWEVMASIIAIDGLFCPALTHGLRGWMHRHGWTQLSRWRLLPRALGATVVLATGVAVLILTVAALIPDNEGFNATGAVWMFVAFAWAFAGWLLIYFAVHTRRRYDARDLQLTLDARNAQLDLLRAQVNPHFLFNCLNSLRALIVENPERASSMVTSLSDLLRYSLQSDRTHTVSLAEELDIVDEYVSLERVRFEERLRFERALDPSALGVRVPPTLVQTLVENAVKHGIADLPDGGVVRMSAGTRGGRVTISVTNTGTMRAPHNDSGHGLRNTIERLRLLYGDAASFTLTDVSGQTVATVTLPSEPARERAAG